MTHIEYASRQNLAVPCASWHVTFGGHCLNCGFVPASPVVSPVVRRNLDGAQYPASRGSQYEGPASPTFTLPSDEEWDAEAEDFGPVVNPDGSPTAFTLAMFGRHNDEETDR